MFAMTHCLSSRFLVYLFLVTFLIWIGDIDISTNCLESIAYSLMLQGLGSRIISHKSLSWRHKGRNKAATMNTYIFCTLCVYYLSRSTINTTNRKQKETEVSYNQKDVSFCLLKLRISGFFCLRICTILTEALSEPVCPTWPESHKKFKDKICSTNIVKTLQILTFFIYHCSKYWHNSQILSFTSQDFLIP